MSAASAALYDLFYTSIKDYPAEAGQLAQLISRARPRSRRVLDVACGTAEHARLLGDVHGFEVDGVDLDPGCVDLARARCPRGRFEVADMTDFQLGRTYDVVLCLYGSIAYAGTPARLQAALACLRDHAVPGGVVVVEPFFTPDAFAAQATGARTVESRGHRITRSHRGETCGRRARVYFDYAIDGPDGARRTSEVHDFGLFTVDDMLAGFAAAGLAVSYDPTGPSGRGIYVGSVVG